MTYGCLSRPHREIRELTWRDFTEDLAYIKRSGLRNKSGRNRISAYNDTSANVVDNFYEYYISIDIASCSTDPFQSFALRSNLEYINPNLVIKDNSWLSSAITFYPNPTSGYLNISINEGLELDGVTIYNALGQKVSQTKGTAQIDVSHIPSGIYYLSISTDQGTVTKTMVRR
jgi:hypothetical protein